MKKKITVLAGLLIFLAGLTVAFGIGGPLEDFVYRLRVKYLTVDGNAVINGTLQAANIGAPAYGMRWDAIADTYETGVLVNGYFNPSAIADYPIQENMKRVVLSDAGVRQYYLCATDSTLKADCSTAANLDGTDGQVMVEIPAFHHIQHQYGDYRYFLVYGSEFKLILPDGTIVHSVLHPAFYKGGETVSYRYIGAYEANLWDATDTTYKGGTSVTEDCNNDKLSSVAGTLPIVNFNRGCGRTMAEARGSGWHQMDAYLYAAISILYLAEYADFNTQDQIGIGITDYETWPNSPQALTGNSNAIGNATGNSTRAVDKWNATTAYSLGDEAIPDASQNGYTYEVTTAGTSGGSEPTWPTTLGNTVVDGTVTWTCVRTDQYMSYRGIENWYGHIWKFLDGINVHNSTANGSRLYLALDYTDFADDTATGYVLAGSLAQADGYVTDIIDFTGIWPASVGGSSSTYIADYYYTYFDNNNDSGWRVALVGAYANDGSVAGAFYVSSSYDSSVAGSNLGGRLCF